MAKLSFNAGSTPPSEFWGEGSSKEESVTTLGARDSEVVIPDARERDVDPPYTPNGNDLEERTETSVVTDSAYEESTEADYIAAERELRHKIMSAHMAWKALVQQRNEALSMLNPLIVDAHNQWLELREQQKNALKSRKQFEKRKRVAIKMHRRALKVERALSEQPSCEHSIQGGVNGGCPQCIALGVLEQHNMGNS